MRQLGDHLWSLLLFGLTVYAITDATWLTFFDDSDDAWIWAIVMWVLTPMLGGCFWYQLMAPTRAMRQKIKDHETFVRMLKELVPDANDNVIKLGEEKD